MPEGFVVIGAQNHLFLTPGVNVLKQLFAELSANDADCDIGSEGYYAKAALAVVDGLEARGVGLVSIYAPGFVPSGVKTNAGKWAYALAVPGTYCPCR